MTINTASAIPLGHTDPRGPARGGQRSTTPRSSSAATASTSSNSTSDDDGGLFPRRVSQNDIIYVTSQLAIMVDTGITLSTALDGILQQEAEPDASPRAGRSEDRRSKAGEDFSTALARYPKLFDKTYVSLVKASEATGTLGDMLDRIADYLRKEVETRGKVRAAMAYPAVMLVVAIGVTIFLLTYILPKFTPLFNRRGMKLPGPTRVHDGPLGRADRTIGTSGWPARSALVAGVLLRPTDRRRAAGLGLAARSTCPIIGPMFRKVTISRSIRTLGTMIASGVPMLDAIRLCGRRRRATVYYEQLWLHVLDQVTTRQADLRIAGRQPAVSARCWCR